MNKTTAAAATLTVLTALSGAGILVHGVGAEPRQDGQSVTSPASSAPRTVVQAAPAPGEPLCAEMLARCAPIPPAPLDAMTDEEREAAASEYTKAWNGIEVTR